MDIRLGNRVLASLVCLLIVSLATFGAGASLVETTTGSVISGTITGISPNLRLDFSPHANFDIPLSSVVQMVIDFPRIVVETPTRVYIGPYSAFSGIDDVVTIQQDGSKRDIPFAALRAIAMNGHSFHAIPRTWLEDGFLTLPAVLSVSPASEQENRTVATPELEGTTSAQTWDELYQTTMVPEEAEAPWWLLLLIIAGLGVLVYLSL